MRYSLGESLRRRIFLAGVVLAIGFIALFSFGLWLVYRHSNQPPEFELAPHLFGLALFGSYFLGIVLVVLLTMSVVRGDAERGLLQQLIVRPISRSSYLAGRLAGALVLAFTYVTVTYLSAIAAISYLADWTPAHWVSPLLLLLAAVTIMGVLSGAGSIWLTGAANGIAMFMVLGLGMLGGLLGQIGNGLGSHDLEQLGWAVSRVVPAEALYQSALHEVSRDESGLTGVTLRLGPFGGSEELTAGLVLWSAGYTALLAAGALRGFRRRDV
jgi:ABC-type transport system involved in multi-copper enzyme maturation permease subunit